MRKTTPASLTWSPFFRHPGVLFARDSAADGLPEKRDRRVVHLPMGRFGEAVEQARCVLFLASEGSSHVIDEGLHVRQRRAGLLSHPDRRAVLRAAQESRL